MSPSPSTPPTVLLVHGFGFGPALWDGMRSALGGLSSVALDLGFLRSGAAPPPIPAEVHVAVGHSLGLLWLLHERPCRWRALVGINAFTRFTRADDFPEGVPVRQVQRLGERLAAAPARAHAEFLALCGAPLPAQPAELVPEALRRGLEALCAWDVRDQQADVTLALQAREDRIVSEAHSRASFAAERLAWARSGGHVLPLSHAAWCAWRIRNVYEAVR